jgi:hypothetical protein
MEFVPATLKELRLAILNGLLTLKELRLAILNSLLKCFALCSARVCALVVMLSDSPCERIEKWKTCPVVKQDRSLVRVWMEHK